MKPPESAAVITESSRIRAFELDALRGLALVMMILHHFIFDLRYLLELDVFAFQETWWFINLLRPLFLNVFIVVSGICCTFSRDNTRRGLRLAGVALLFNLAFIGVSYFSGEEFYVIFSVLHLLAAGILVYSLITFGERKKAQRLPRVDVIIILLAALFLWAASLLPDLQGRTGYWLIPFGLLPANGIGMADYLPLIPWLGFFLAGAAIGRQVYSARKSALGAAPRWLKQITRPLCFLGRNSLLVYILHQPVLLTVLYSLRFLGLL